MKNFWETLLKFVGYRAAARAAGASSNDANKAAGTQVLLEEVAKKAAEAEAKKQ